MKKIYHEIVRFEKNLINRISNLSRPITKFSYTASKETQEKLATMMNEPLEIFDDNSQYVQLLNELKKRVTERSIQIKDPQKTMELKKYCRNNKITEEGLFP